MKSWKKYRWPLTLVLIVAAGLVFAFWPRAIVVELAGVSAGPMTATIDDDAITRIKEVYTVTTPVAGRILRVERHAGDDVIAGKTVLFSIFPAQEGFLDPRTRLEREAARKAAQDARDVARAQLEGAKAVLDNARIEYSRASELLKKNAVAKSRVDQAQREFRTAESGLSAAKSILSQREAQLNQAKAALLTPMETGNDYAVKGLEIKAPETGKVLKVFQENESVVTVGTALMEIGNPGNLEIIADFLSRDALKVSPGNLVFIENWGGEGTLNGKVRLVEPAGTTKVSSLGIDEQRVNIVIDIADPPERWASLGHGYQVDVRISVWQKDNVLRVPVGALFRRGDNWAVFHNENGVARMRFVKIGHMSNREAEILEGLAAGDKVIAYPTDTVKEGVKIRESNNSAR